MNIKENESGGDILKKKKKKSEFQTPAEVSISVSCGKGQFCFGSPLPTISQKGHSHSFHGLENLLKPCLSCTC